MNPIMTYGYGGTDPAALLRFAEQRNAIVVDIRLRRYSADPRWQEENLRTTFGPARYLALTCLGNVNYRTGGPIKLANPRGAVSPVHRLLQHGPVILLCGCRDVHSCHRTEAADYLATQLDAPVEHLDAQAIAVTQRGGTPVLTVRQPWAWALLHAGKDIENRDWPTSLRGRIAIHASKGMTRAEYEDAAMFIYDITGRPIPLLRDLVRGAIIGTVELVDCVEHSDSPWFAGSYGLVVRDPRPLSTPIEARGALGFWTYEGEL